MLQGFKNFAAGKGPFPHKIVLFIHLGTRSSYQEFMCMMAVFLKILMVISACCMNTKNDSSVNQVPICTPYFLFSGNLSKASCFLM